MSDKIVFREAILQDAPGISKLFKAFFDFHKHRDSYYKRTDTAHGLFKEFLIKAMGNEKCLILVAEHDRQIIGYCVSVVTKKPRIYKFRDYGLIDMIAVSKGCRNKGVGERLVKMSFDWFRSKGIHRVEVEVAVCNEVSRAFWKKFEFVSYEEKQYLML